MKIEYQELQAIRQIDLPNLLQGYGIELKKNGSYNNGHSYQCLCPFHDDKNPSLHLNRKKGKWLWNCFGCRASGNVMDFVIKYEGLSFAQAYYKLLKISGRHVEQPKEQKHTPSYSINKQEILQKVVNYYHETYLEDKRGSQYLAERGIIVNAEIYKTFNIGFCNGSLKEKLPARRSGGPQDQGHEYITALKDIGILNAKGNEHFYNCVVFPIYDENGNVCGLYGRSVVSSRHGACSTYNPPSNSAGVPHLYLSGEHKGVWNWQTLKINKEVVVTEGIIDALSCYVLGEKNVIPLYGVNGLTEGHIRLFGQYRTEKVYLCFDNDDAGHNARKRVKEKLEPLGIDVKNIHLPAEYKDLNDALAKGRTEFSFKTIKEEAEGKTITQKEHTSDDAGNPAYAEATADKYPKVEKQDDSINIDFGVRSYRIRGLTTKNLERMRINVKVQEGDSEAYHLDTLDLYSSKSRAIFISHTRKIMQAKEAEMSKELNRIIDELEKIQAESLDPSSAKATEGKSEMTEQEKKEAIAFLKSPSLLADVLNDLELIGYVGEEANKALGFLVSISRKLEEPLSCVIISQSSAGKSVLAETLEKLVPGEECLLYSRITPQALYYMDSTALKRKLLVIEERVGAESADYSIRTLQSKKKLTQAVPIKDPNTGRIRTVSFEVEGPVAYIETTTRPRINEENATRCFELYLDESREQTMRIHEAQRELKTLRGLKKKEHSEKLMQKHHNMQRCLREIKVVNPFAHLLEFPAEWLRTRRDHLRFLNLIEVITFLYQHQRPVKYIEDNGACPSKPEGRSREYIESTIEDYRIAYNLAKDVLGESFTELKRPQRELLIEVKKLMSKYGEVTRRQIRVQTGLSNRRLMELLSDLVDLEYLCIVEGKQGRSFRYRLSEDIIISDKIIKNLTKPEELAEKIKKDDKQWKSCG